MTSFWLVLWALALSGSWLLPHHYLPWTAFHADAWCAVVLMAGSATIAVRIRSGLRWHALDIAILGLTPIPLLQYAFGLIPFFGQTATVTAYLLGLLLASLTGARWEKGCPDQAINGLFIAIGTAAVLSVSLQFHTWLNLIDTGIFDIWSMGLGGSRPYANLGQPNQLATLLLWGVLASAWAFNARVISAWVSVLLVAFLLTGIALTQSRTAWLGLIFLMACSWRWRALWRSASLPWVAVALSAYFLLCYFYLHSLGFLLSASNESFFRDGESGGLRFAAWRVFISAALERPWFGYGWTEVGHAQLEVARNFPALYSVFGHSHNLMLDLVLWLGIPLGVSASVALALWYLEHLRAVQNAKDGILIMFLGVVGIHAMLELPLHYAYFLLPVGMVVGVVNQRSIAPLNWTSPRWTLLVGWAVAALVLVGIVRDYFEIESSFREARFEAARIGTLPVGKSPDVVLLTQLRDNIDFMRYEVATGMPSADLEWLKAVVIAYPTGGRMYKVAKALALNGQPEEAAVWLRRIRKISSPDEYALIQRVWLNDSRENDAFAAIPWPSDD